RNIALERPSGVCHPVEVWIRRRTNGWQHPPRNGEEAKEFIIPIKSLEIKEHRATGVGNIRDVHTAIYSAGQVPDNPRVYIAEDGLTSFGRSPRACDIVENPLNLAARKISCGRQTCF